MRFSLKGLLGLVSFSAMAMAMMAHPNYYPGVALSLAIASIVLAIVLAVASQGRMRVMSICYAISACAHLLLALGPWLENSIGLLLITRNGLDWLFVAMEYDGVRAGRQVGVWAYLQSTPSSGYYSYASYIVVGQSILSGLIGFLGSLVGAFVFDRRSKQGPVTP